MGKKLTASDINAAASEIGTDTATIKAVKEVEAAGAGYDKSGRLKLRFEGHHFKKYTGGKYDASNPNISYPYKVQRSKPHGYEAFNEAFALDPHAAMISTSWGLFQPMGVYFDECGYVSAGDMVDAFRAGEGNQLLGFVKMCKTRGIDDELRRHDWAGFAKNYNGKDYKVNSYDTKLASAYRRFLKAGDTVDEPDAPSVDVAEAPAGPTVNVENAENVTAPPPPVKGGSVGDTPQEVAQTKPSWITRIIGVATGIATPLGAAGIKLGGFQISSAAVIAMCAFGIVGLIVGAWIYNEGQKRAARLTELQLLNRARPQEINVALKQE